MRKRDIMILFLMMACFTGAVMATIVYQEQARVRGIRNIETICRQLERLTKEPCGLKEPPSGIRDKT